MFGFGKKKTTESPTKPGRSRVSAATDDKEKNKAETRAQLNLFGVAGVGDEIDVDVGDDDLEDELLALLGDDGKAKRSKPRAPPPRPQRPGKNKPQPTTAATVDPFAMSNYDVDIDSGGDDDDDEIDEAELEAELGELTGQVVATSHVQKSEEEQAPVPVSSNNTVSGESMVQMLQERLVMYQKAKARSDASGETSKSRRFVRGIKTLEDLVKKAKLDKVIDESDIPPVVALGETKPTEDGNGNVNSSPPPMSTSPFKEPDLIPTFDPIPPIPQSTPPLPLVQNISSPEPKASDESAPESGPDFVAAASSAIVIIAVDPLVDERLKDYKKMAVALKRSGDSQGGLHYLKLAKTLEAAIKSGTTIDLSAFPVVSDPSQSKSSEQSVTKVETEEKSTPQPQASEAQPATGAEAETVGLPNELFAGPEAPKTIMEALKQRLDKYKSEVEKATNDNNSSKARRMGRIVKQYEEAITFYKKGKPVDYESLPTPPGFGPIPVPGVSSTAATGAGSVSGNSEAPPSSSSLHPPPQGMAGGSSPKVPRPASDPSADAAGPSPTKVVQPSQGPSASPGTSSSITRGGKPGVKLTLQEKQLNEILLRQKMFKEAAVNAKKLGDVTQAREFLRTAKGFDQLIEASKSGLPVDMNTLPSPPQAVSLLEAEDFEVVSGEDCIEPTGDLAEVFSKLEEDLKNQLKICMRTREHFKKIGDIASANKFEKMALESKRDLDTLRIAAKQGGGSVPKYHYETRIFSMTECNTDLTEDEIEITVMQGINYKVANPADVDTFVKVELPYPSAEEAQVNKTAVVKDTNNPTYNATFKMTVNRSARNFQRFIHNKGIKFEVWSKGGLCTSCGRLIFCRRGFLRSSTLIGTATAKLLGLETKCTVHDAFEVLDGRKLVGKLEVKINLRDPVLMKHVTQKKEKWLSIDRL